MVNRSIQVSEVSPFNDEWRNRVEKGLAPAGVALLRDAVECAAGGLSGRPAETGEPLSVHSAGSALILAAHSAEAQAPAAAGVAKSTAAERAAGHADIQQVRMAFGAG